MMELVFEGHNSAARRFAIGIGKDAPGMAVAINGISVGESEPMMAERIN